MTFCKRLWVLIIVYLTEMPNSRLKSSVSQDRRAKTAIKKGNSAYPEEKHMKTERGSCVPSLRLIFFSKPGHNTAHSLMNQATSTNTLHLNHKLFLQLFLLYSAQMTHVGKKSQYGSHLLCNQSNHTGLLNLKYSYIICILLKGNVTGFIYSNHKCTMRKLFKAIFRIHNFP